MCNAACFRTGEKLIIVNFAQMDAALPILKSNQQIITLPWGRRKKERGVLPLGGWITQENLHKGKWDKYFPKRVKLPILKFQETDYEGQGIWFDVTPGHWMQGLYMQENDERRVYIVTLVPSMSDNVFSRWPYIFSD